MYGQRSRSYEYYSTKMYRIQSNTFDGLSLTVLDVNPGNETNLIRSCMSLGYKSLVNYRLGQNYIHLYIKPFISIIDIMEIFKTIVFLLLCGTVEAKKRSFCNAQTCNKCAKIYVFGRSSNSKLALVSNY